MKVVHLINGLHVGGAEMMLYKLVSSGAADGAEHAVVSMLDGGPVGTMIEQAGVPVYTLGMERGRASIGAFFRLVGLLRRLQPDVIQTWMYHANLLGLVANSLSGRAPIVWGLRHANLDVQRNKASTLRIARASARLSRWTDAVVCCSQKTLEVHEAVGYASEKLRFIPNGFDVEAFSPDPAARQALRASLGISDATPVFGMAGRYDPLKDHATFLRAAQRLHTRRPDAKFVLCGSGIGWDNEALVADIRAAGLEKSIVLLGRRDDMAAIMNALDAHVLSSVGEGFPNVLGEAMACGTPCITTDVGDAALIVGETGWVVPPRDPDALAEAMEAFAALPSEARDLLKRKARAEVVDRFSLDAIRAQYHAVYRDVASTG